MELNITIFIQVINLLVLFVFLSNALFKPLNKLFEERWLQTLGKKSEANDILEKINKQEIYIQEQTSLVLNKAKAIYLRMKVENEMQKEHDVKTLDMQSKEKYQTAITKLRNETNIVRKELLGMKDILINDILQQLYKN